MYYKEEILEEIREKNDIVDVISSYIRIQKKGNSHLGLCPFHNEKTPSFSVSAQRQVYTCFGCGQSGDVISFVMKYENYSFIEAVKHLAQRAGIQLEDNSYTEEDRIKQDRKSSLLQMHKEAAKYYYYCLGKNSFALNYLKNRGIKEDTIRKFGLGFAPKSSDSLYKFLKKDYDDELIKLSGLAIIEEKGAKDRFWNRIMYPIMDVHNKVIGFGGRVLGDALPKYINSSESLIFDKSRQLYGLNFAKLSKEDSLILCEGYMDVISLHQAGVDNAIAALGTAFTPTHANILKRYTKKLILCLDADTAGINAAKRAISILRETDISVYVIDLLPYKDPDEFIKNLSKEEFELRLKNSKNAFMWEIDILKRDYMLEDPDQKTRFYRAVADRLLEFKENLERDNYTQAVCKEHLISYEEMKSLLYNKAQTGAAIKKEAKDTRLKNKKKEDPILKSQRILLSIMIEDTSYVEKIAAYLTEDDFEDELYKEVLGKIKHNILKGISMNSIINEYAMDEEKMELVSKLFTSSLTEEINLIERKKIAEENILKLRQYRLDELSKACTDISQLQKIITEQAKLKRDGISID